MNESLYSIGIVWTRYFDVFRKNIFYGLLSTVLEPLMYLLAFGFGLGTYVQEVTVAGVTLRYRAFVLSGLVAQALLFQAFFEAAYGGFIRMYYQKIFQAISVTPITLSEVLWGELLWDATKGTFAASTVLIIGTIAGEFTPLRALATVPFVLAGAFLFSGLGQSVAAISRTIEDISYPQYLLVFPMFLFCGIYYPVTALPWGLSALTEVLPLTGLVAIIRSVLLGLPFPTWSWISPAVWLVGCVYFGRRHMTRRLVK